MKFWKRLEKWELFMAFFVLVSAWVLFSGTILVTGESVMTVSSRFVGKTPYKKTFCVVLDAGHGGADPGKIGVDGTLEKDINLRIVKRVQTLLEQQDVEVILTRETDDGLYDEGAENKKVQDMKRRCERMNESKPDCVISIHQNSYHEERIQGAQVFYYTTSREGKVIAEILQQELIRVVDPDNKRQAKANDSYYLLKETEPPICIVECGFLSNWEECKLLQNGEYQEKLAWAIHLGILKYLNQM